MKLTLKAKAMNAQLWKNKYQMSNMHGLIDSATQIITKKMPGKVWFASLYLKYASSQLPLSDLTSNQVVTKGSLRITTCWFKTMKRLNEEGWALD